MKINRNGKKSGKNPTTKSKNDEKTLPQNDEKFYIFICLFTILCYNTKTKNINKVKK